LQKKHKMRKKTIILLFLTTLISLNAQTKKMIINSLKVELNEMNKKHSDLQIEYDKLIGKIAPKEEYRIQLGINSITKPLNLGSNHKINGTNIDDKIIYDIGGFSNSEDAFNFAMDFRNLNLTGAFVTKYINGNRDYNYRYDYSMPIPIISKEVKPVNFIMPSSFKESKSISNNSKENPTNPVIQSSKTKNKSINMEIEE
jgi:hypothetical protein